MRRLLLIAAACAAVAGLPALDLDYTISVGGGAAMALGGDLDEAIAEFAAASGADAIAAPVLGQAYGLGVEAPLGGAFGIGAGLTVRRLGYAMWAADSGALSWAALWTAGLKIGLTATSRGFFAGLGFAVEAPISGLSQYSGSGGAGIEVDYGTDSGKMLIPGAYLDAGYEFGKAIAAGKARLYPRLSLSAGAWPVGIVDGLDALELYAGLSFGFRVDTGASK